MVLLCHDGMANKTYKNLTDNMDFLQNDKIMSRTNITTVSIKAFKDKNHCPRTKTFILWG